MGIGLKILKVNELTTFESFIYPVTSLSKLTKIPFYRVCISTAAASGLLGIFVAWNFYLHERSLHINQDQAGIAEREVITDTSGLTSIRLAYHDFESGNAGDTASHLAAMGHHGNQSLTLSSRVQFSPGLWVKFRDLTPGDSSWIRATGYVWFSCPPGEVKCSLVATCNHNGVNFKYMFIALEKENLKPNQWNRVSIDYRIPQAHGPEDVLQAYFWYRGKGEVLVDDVEVTMLKK
jgi:hypothetical protein